MMRNYLDHLRRSFIATTLAAVVAVVSASSPALADANYNPTNPLFALFPDICTFVSSCITFTDSTAINGMNNVINQIEEGNMHVQDLKSGPLAGLGALGIGDPVGGNMLNTLLGQIGRADPTQAAMACHSAVADAGTGNRIDLLSLFGVQQMFGTGHLSSAQIASVVMQKLASTSEAQNQCKAAEAKQEQANIAKSYVNFGGEFDLAGDAAAGWP